MALIKCKECNHQISNQAKTCPNCGCPVELNKGSLVHWMGMGIGFTVAITLLLIYAIFKPSKPLTPEEQAAKSYIEACKNDYTSCNNNADLINNYSKMFDATRACQDVIEDKTKYGVEWPVFPFGSFSSGEDYPETGAILIADKQLEVKNEFGTFGKAIAKCRYNLASSKVIMATLDEKIIYADTSAIPIAYKNIVDVASTNEKVKTAINKLSSVWFKQDFQYRANKIRVVFIKSQSIDESGKFDKDCHACGVDIAAVTYKQINNDWQFVAKQENIKIDGKWGDVPQIKQANIVKLTPNKVLFLIKDSDLHQGYEDTSESLYLLSQNKWVDLGYIPTGGGECSYVDEGHATKCYKFVGKISAIPSEKEYPDLLVTKTGTELDEKQNIIKAKNSAYIFKDGKYTQQVGADAKSYAPSLNKVPSNYPSVISNDEQRDLHKDTIFKLLNRPSIDSCPEKIIIKNKYSHQYIFNKDGQLGIVFWSNQIPELVYENINFKREIVAQGFDPRTYKINNEPVCIANKVFTIESFGDYAKCDSNLSCETYIKADVPQNWYINNEKMITLENMKKQVIKDFYNLLTKGDINTAEDFLVFEKRNKGAFEVNKMKAFYEHMIQPISLLSVEATGEDTFNVSYKYTKNISECNGNALVETYQDKSNGAIYIQKISANC